MQRRTSNSGGIMVVGQKIALGRQHARQVITVHVSATALTVELDGATTRTYPRTTELMDAVGSNVQPRHKLRLQSQQGADHAR